MSGRMPEGVERYVMRLVDHRKEDTGEEWTELHETPQINGQWIKAADLAKIEAAVEERVRERLRKEAAAKVEEAEKRVAGERPKDRHERLKELLGSDWPVVTLMRNAGAKLSPPWAWWMEDNGYDHDKYEVEHYLPVAAFNTLLDSYTEQGGPSADRRALLEFDAWLSLRGEFGEVLTAFRKAFGTDTSAAAADDPKSEYRRALDDRPLFHVPAVSETEEARS